ADGTQEDRVVTTDLLEDRVREGLARGVPAASTEVVLGALEGDARRGGDDVEHLECLGGDFGADSIAGDDGERVRGHETDPREAVSGSGRRVPRCGRVTISCRRDGRRTRGPRRADVPGP